MCDSGCWTQGQMEVSAACHTTGLNPQRPRQTPYGTAAGIRWEEPGQYRLQGRNGNGSDTKNTTQEKKTSPK